MYQLEERILFDGAAAVDLAVAQQEQQAQEAQAQTDAQPQTDTAAPGAQPQTVAPDKTAPALLPADTHSSVPSSDIASADTSSASLSAPIDASNPSQPSDTHHVNVLVVSDSLENADQLFKSANSDTILVRYNDKSTTGAELLQEITDALHGEKADSIGFVTDKAHDGSVKIFADSDTSENTLSSETQQKFWNGVEGLLSDNGKVNIFASDLASTANGRHLVDSLSQITNHQVAASTDVTGDKDAGGDWELEYVAKGSGSVDLIEEYFNRESIQSFDHRIEKPTEIAFIDSSVRDIDTILKGIGEQAEIVYLNKDHAFEQITSYLQGRADVDAVHLISDGTSGEFYLGNETVNTDFIASHQDELAAWGKAMAADGDIHIYGCELAKDQVGKDLVNQISVLTGADVAASTDRTGIAGNWNLEFTAGEIQTAGFVIGDYLHNLKTLTVIRLVDAKVDNPISINPTNLTLREALLIAVDGDNIVFADPPNLISDPAHPTDPYTIFLVDTLVIDVNITIDGEITFPTTPVTYRCITIDAQNSCRALYIDTPMLALVNPVTGDITYSGVTISDLIFINGDSSVNSIEPSAGDGGGIHITNRSYVDMTDIQVNNSNARYGGGIYNAGILTMKSDFKVSSPVYLNFDLDISSNTATNSGGGIYNAGTLTFTGGSLFSNTAQTGHGGGIYNSGAVAINSAGLSFNSTSAGSGGSGGGIYSNTGDFVFTNSGLYYNTANVDGGGICIIANYQQTDPIWLFNILASNNSAGQDGGVVYFTNGNSAADGTNVMNLEWCNFEDNTAGQNGGAVCLEDNSGSITIATVIQTPGVTKSVNVQSEFLTNSATLGGALYIENCNGNLTVDFVNISNNTAVDGAAVYIANSTGSITLSDIEMSGNSATRLGGGIFYSSENSPAFNVTSSNISNNSASVAGGGIYLEKGNLNLVNCTLAYNGTDSSTKGGAIFMDAGTLEINFTTIAYNRGVGAAIYLDNSAAEIVLVVNNSIIYNLDSEFSGITPTIESQIYIADPSNMSPSSVFNTDNNIYSHYYVDLAVPGNHALSLGNVDSNRLIGYNSTATPLHAGDKSKYIQSYLWLDQTLRYHANYRTMALAILNQNSWAFNAGDIQSDVICDQRGNDRNGFYYTWVAAPSDPDTGTWVKNTPAAGTKQSTIGAFEPLFHVEVTSKGDDSSLTSTGDLNAEYFSDAVGGTGLTLREAVYWIDTRAALDPNNPTHYTYTDPFPPVPPNPANNFTVSDYNNRYISFDTDPTHLVNFSSLNASNIIQLSYGAIRVDGDRWGFFVNNDAASYRDIAIAYLVRNTNNSGDIVYHDDTLRAHDALSRITVAAGGGALFSISAPSVAAINNLTLINGLTTSATNYCGGGIYNLGGTDLTRTTLTNVVIQNCTATGSTSSDFGGGIYNGYGAYMNVYDSSIINNTASAPSNAHGGGIYNTGVMHIDRTQISGNIARNTSALGGTVFGGGIYNGGTSYSGTIIIERSEISENSLSGTCDATHTISIKGGGIYNSTANFRIANSTIAENTLNGVTQCAIWNNYGSGIYNGGTQGIYSGGILYSYYNTIANNKLIIAASQLNIDSYSATLETLAGLYQENTAASTLFLSNCILAENYAVMTGAPAPVTEIWQRADIFEVDGAVCVDSSSDYNIIGAYNGGGSLIWTYTQNKIPFTLVSTPAITGNILENNGTALSTLFTYTPAMTGATQAGYDWNVNHNIIGNRGPSTAAPAPDPGISVPVYTNPNPAQTDLYYIETLAVPARAGQVYRYDAVGVKVYVTFSVIAPNGLITPVSNVNDITALIDNMNALVTGTTYSTYTTPPQSYTQSLGSPSNIRDPQYGLVANLNMDFESGLQYNGALTRTYRILDGSVALDTGITVVNPGGFLNFGTDQRGVERDPLNHGVGTATNRGAFDYLDLITVRSAFDSNSPRTGFDFENYRPLWDSSTLTLREAVMLADDGSGIDFKADWRINGTTNPLTGAIVVNELDTDGNLIIDLASELQITRSTTVDFYPIPSIHVVIGNMINGAFTWIDGNGITHAGKTNWVDADGVTHAGGTNQLNAAANSRILNVDSATANWLSAVTIGNFTMNGGNVSGNGGGIFSAANLLLDNVIVQNCAATGLYTAKGAYSSAGLGGGIYSDAGYLKLTNSRVTGNNAVMGGGIYYASWSNSVNTGLYVSASSILNNSAKDSTLTRGDGGGIYLQSGDAKIEYSAIGLNKAVSDGGGVFVATSNAALNIFNSTVANNTAGRNGAGISFYSNSTLDLNFVTVANNQSGWSVNGTASGNTYAFGGGICMNSGSLNIANSILAQNYRGSSTAASPLHDDLYLKNFSPNTIDYSVYGAVDGIKNANGTPRYALTVSNSTHVTNWNTFAGKLDTRIINNGGKTETVFVIDNSFFQTADTAYPLQVDQTLTYVWDYRSTAGALERAPRIYYYIDGEIGKGAYNPLSVSDGGSRWVSANGLLLTEYDGVLNTSNATFVLQTGLFMPEMYYLDYTKALDSTVTMPAVFDPLGYMISTPPAPHITSGTVTLNYNWDMKDPLIYGSSLALRVNAFVTISETVVAGVAIGGKISVSCAAGDANTLILNTANFTPAGSTPTYLSIHATTDINGNPISNNIVTYSSVSPTQKVFTLDELGASNTYDYLNFYGKDSTKNAAGTLNVLQNITIGTVLGPNLGDNVTLNITSIGTNFGDLVFSGNLIHDYGHIVIERNMDAADFAIDGIANYSTMTVGNLRMSDFTMTDLKSVTVNAGDLTMLRGIISGVPAFAVSAGDLLMTDTIATGVSSITVFVDMTMDTGSIINGVSIITVGGDMTMSTSTITSAAVTISATGNMVMTSSTIDTATRITVGNPTHVSNLNMTSSSITGNAANVLPVTLVTVTGDINLVGATNLTNLTISAGGNKTITFGNAAGAASTVTLNAVTMGAATNTLVFKNISNLTVIGPNNQIISNGLTVNGWSGIITVNNPGLPVSPALYAGALKIDIGAQNLILTSNITSSTPTTLSLGLDRLVVGSSGNNNNRFEVVTSGTVASSNAVGANIFGTLAVSGVIKFGSNDFKINLQPSATLELGGTITITKDATGSAANITMVNSLNIVGNVTVSSLVTGNISITSTFGSVKMGSDVTAGSKFTGNMKNLTVSAFTDASVGNMFSIANLYVTSQNGDIHLLNSITVTGSVSFTSPAPGKGVLVHKAFKTSALKLSDTSTPIMITAGTAGTINTTGAGYSAYLGDGSELLLSAGSTTLTNDLNTVNLNRSLTLTKGKYISDGITLTGATANFLIKGIQTVTVTGSISLAGGRLDNPGVLSVTGNISMAGVAPASVALNNFATGTVNLGGNLNLTGNAALANAGIFTGAHITLVNGSLSNTKTLSASSIIFSGTGALTNSSKMTISGVITLAGGNLTNAGTLTAGGALTLTGAGTLANNSGSMTVNTLTMGSGNFTNMVAFTSSNTAANTGITFTGAGSISNSATLTTNLITLNGGGLTNSGIITEKTLNAKINITGIGGPFTNTGTMAKVNNITFTGGGALTNSLLLTASGNVTLAGGSLTNTGTMTVGTVAAGTGNITLIGAGSLNNNAGTLTANAVTLASGNLTNKVKLLTNAIDLGGGNLTNSGTIKERTNSVSHIALVGGGTFTNTGTVSSYNNAVAVSFDTLTLNGANLVSPTKTFNVTTLNLMGAGTNLTISQLGMNVGTLNLSTGNAIMAQGKLTVTGDFNFDAAAASQYFQLGNPAAAIANLEVKGTIVHDDISHFFVTKGNNKIWVKPGTLASGSISFFLNDSSNLSTVSQIDINDTTSAASKPVGLNTFTPLTRNGKPVSSGGIPVTDPTSSVARAWNITRSTGEFSALTVKFHWSASEQGPNLNVGDPARLWNWNPAVSTWSVTQAEAGAGFAGNTYETSILRYSGSYSVSNFDPSLAMNDSSSLGAQLEELKEKFFDAIFGAKEEFAAQPQLAETQERTAMETMLSQMADRSNLMERNQLFKSEVDLGLEALLMA
jgi:hypothetical protein